MIQGPRYRVSLGELAVYIALVAVYQALMNSRGPSELTGYYLVHGLLGCGTIAVLYFNRRLSGWAWLVLACWFVEPIKRLVLRSGLLAGVHLPPELAFMLPSLLASTLHGVGLFLVFRDIRRRLAAATAPPRPDDGDAPPAGVS